VKLKIKDINKMSILILVYIFIFTSILYSQIDPNNPALTRGKMWWGYKEYNENWHYYPGYWGIHYNYWEDLHPNMIIPETWDWQTFTKDGVLGWTRVGLNERFVSDAPIPGQVMIPSTHFKNHNFSVDPYKAEEQYIVEYIVDLGITQGNRYRLKAEKVVWSLPKYDDFIITRLVLTNEDTVPLNDWCIAWVTYPVQFQPGYLKFGFHYDLEYEWVPDLETHTDENGAFVFYDDTSIPLSTPDSPVEYFISPGDVTGDRGDPGNITQPNSIDFQLYFPMVFTRMIVDCTPNRDGNKEVRKLILADPFETTAPDEERLTWQTETADQIRPYTQDYDQTRMSWREAKDDPGTIDGSVWERNPQWGYAIGPYDVAIGDSIEIIYVSVAGEIDRSISMRGGLEATQNFKRVGMDNLKENWAAAIELIDAWEASGSTNWNAGITEYPPPPPANTPMVGNDDELMIVDFVDIENGTQGFDVSWKPIPDSYQDPIKGTNDLAGYKVYKSEQSVMGPWIEIADLSKADAANLESGGMITYRAETKVGIPTRFLVTSYDTDGLESGTTGYSFFAKSANAAPSNTFSDVRVVPNPFKQTSGLPDLEEQKRLLFVGIPAKCTIRIFNVAGELIQTLEHDGFGSTTWGSSEGDDYMATRFYQNVAPGIYIYHIESHVPGHEGESATGKFAIIK